MRRLTKIAAVTAVLALAVTGCGKNDARRPAAGRQPSASALQDRQGQRPEGRPGLRRRRSWRPVLQRLGVRRPQEGRRGPRRDLQRGRGHDLTSRTPPARSACARSPTRGYDPIIAVGFVYSPMVDQGRRGVPEDSTSRSSTARPDPKATRTSPTWPSPPNEGSFLVGVAAALKTKTKHSRLRRWRAQRPDHEPFEAGYSAGVEGGQPRHQGRRQVPHPGPGRPQTAFANPAGGKAAATAMYRRRCRHRLPRGRRVRPRCLRGGRAPARQVGHRCRLRPVPHRAGGPEDAHPDLGAQARRRRGRTT